MAGTVLVWLPILATLVFALVSLVARGRFLVDFLMPAELFPVVVVGGALLLWGALRARSRQKLVAWGLGLVVAMLLGSQLFAVLTGVASGRTEPAGWAVAVVVAALAIYALAVVELGVAGILLLRDLFRSRTAA